MTDPRGPTACSACGGKNFNWARRCDHCGASLSGSPDAATTSSEVLPGTVLDIDPPKIPTMQYQLADHGHPERIGLADRFTFLPADLRELSIMTWTSLVAAVGILVATTVLETPVAVWLTAVACVALLCITAALCLRWRSRMRRAFEVSPFGLSEIHDDGTIRRIVFVGFSRLVGLIVAKGGFVVDGPQAV